MVSTRTTLTPAGSGRLTLALIRVTSAPRAAAARARAYPCRPEDRLPRNRTGSRYSRVPPAETTTWRPARSAGVARPRAASTSSASSKISAGSGSRPLPVSLPVSRPSAGSITTAPRWRRVATLAWVAACSHISVCMAGANTTGQRAVSRVLVSRSSASPWAAFASTSAVAGATTTRSASWPIRTCGTSWTSFQTSAETGLPESAAQVAAPTKCSAAAVGTTVTSCPDSVKRRVSSQALYAAMPPVTPRTTRGRAPDWDTASWWSLVVIRPVGSLARVERRLERGQRGRPPPRRPARPGRRPHR